jgi:hypothetical protein
MRRGSDGFYVGSVTSMVIIDDGRLISDGRHDDGPVDAVRLRHRFDGVAGVHRLSHLRQYALAWTRVTDSGALAVTAPSGSSTSTRGRFWCGCRSIEFLDLAVLPSGVGVLVGDMAGHLTRFDYVAPTADRVGTHRQQDADRPMAIRFGAGLRRRDPVLGDRVAEGAQAGENDVEYDASSAATAARRGHPAHRCGTARDDHMKARGRQLGG